MVHENGSTIAPSVRTLNRARLRLVEPSTSMRPTVQRRESLQRRLLGAADLLAAAFAVVVVILGTGANNPGIAVVAATPLVVVLFKVAGLYDRGQMRLVHSTLDEAPKLLQLTGLYTLAMAIFAPALMSGDLSSPQIAGIWVLGFVGTLVGRSIARAIAGKSSPEERCLVIGEPEIAERVRDKIRSSSARASVIATLPLGTDPLDGGETLESLRSLVYEHSIDRVIIAPATIDTQGVHELIRVAKAAGVRVSLLPRMLEVVGSAVEFDDVDGLTMLGVRPFGLSRSSRALKRAFDIVGDVDRRCIAVAPILAVVAVAIRLDSRGPILFRQMRIGRDGEPFEIFKFRSMVVDAEAQKDALRDRNEAARSMFKIADDPRVTRVGTLPAPDVARRAAAALQRAARRDEPRRPAAARHRRGRAGRSVSTAAGCT